MKVFQKYLALLFTAICIVIIIYVILNYPNVSNVMKSIASSGKVDKSRKTEDSPAAYRQEETPQSSESAINCRDFVYPMDNTRDPFQRMPITVELEQPQMSAAKDESIMLTGIVWNAEDPIAIVTDSDSKSHLLRTGEEIGTARILTIRPRSVIIELDGKSQELVLWP